MKSLTLDNIIYDDNKNKQKISGDNQGENGIAKFNFYFDGNYKHKIKRNIIDNLKVPHYIKIGTECPICYDEIYNRNNALLTDCGHSFHYSCIINYDYKNSFDNNGIYCPICRQDMGNYYNLNENYKLPKICYNLHLNKFNSHFHRMDYFNCFYCQI